MLRLPCPFAKHGCPARFKARAGVTNHMRTEHSNANLVRPVPTSNPPASPSNRDNSPAASSDMPQQGHREPDLHDFPVPDPPDATPPETTESNKIPRRTYHYYLTGEPTDEFGNPVPENTPAPARYDDDDKWYPFGEESEFLLADFAYRSDEMSTKRIDELLEIWALDKAKHNDFAPFSDHTQMYDTIDAIEEADVPWQSFSMQYHSDDDNPANTSWKVAKYEVWYRDPTRVIASMLDNPDFDGQFDYAPYVELDKSGKRKWSDFMSGNFAWRHSTRIYEEDNTRKGCMLCPVILGSDKTTVSVATGHVEYHPLYLSIGNVHNTVRRAHRNAVIPIGFLAIPKSDRQYDNDAVFRKFRRQLYHTSISRILKPLKDGMTTPVVYRCPDGHYRRVIFELASFIADYPEQVALAGIVQNWCPRCTALNKDLDGSMAGPRERSFTETLIEEVDGTTLWDSYGIDNDILPFTHDFPRADIHEILTPDLLHQVIKGTFKDHLVTWAGEYLVLEHGAKEADAILDDIDRRIAAAPSFPCLRRFPHGRRFKQWTGDDSKALMKVYLPAIEGYVPDEMLKAISAFLDFCYIARRADITEDTLESLDKALQRFHLHREVFRTTGVRPTGFSLPRQHALSHYRVLIQDFGAPGGICSSITESRHITAVKKPWRRSNRYEALGQMLLTNQRLDKLAALRVKLANQGLLSRSRMVPVPVTEAVRAGRVVEEDEDGEWETVEDKVDFVLGNVKLARKYVPGSAYPHTFPALATHVGEPRLVEMTRRFLFEQQRVHNRRSTSPSEALEDSDTDGLDRMKHAASAVQLSDCPYVCSRPFVYHSAVATFYAPSDESGIRGMKRERIRSTPSWRNQGERRDCALVVVDDSKPGMRGMAVTYPCALVDWFKTYGSHPDPNTGMWRVVPEIHQGQRLRSVIHLDTLLRGVHLLPVYGTTSLPSDFMATYDTLSSFKSYYVNKFADHHAHEIIY